MQAQYALNVAVMPTIGSATRRVTNASVASTARGILMDIIEDRHEKHSTIITSQMPVKGWYDAIGEKTIADAILDRLVHHALRVELYGESIRKRKKMKTTINDKLSETDRELFELMCIFAKN